MDWSKFAEHGFEGLIVGTLFFILWRIIVYTMDFVKQQSLQQAEERKQWQAIINGIKTSMDMHNQQSIDAHGSIREGLNRARAEHEKMIEILTEQTTVLGRINGYKHE